MTKVYVTGQPHKRARAGRVMSVGAGTTLIAVGAILLFALTTDSPHWLNLRVVGFILIVTGVLGLAIPRLSRSRGTLYRRWVVPMTSPRRNAPPVVGELVRTRDTDGETPTLADDLLRREHDPPI
jgi:hypothetical protein